MKQIQYVSKYIALAEEGLVQKLECPMDQGLLLSNLDSEDNIFLYCLSCNFKNYMGQTQYLFIKKMVEQYDRTK